MCIRDSVQHGQATDAEAAHRAQRFDGLRVGRDRHRILLHAVSYTHLRAHETVLDLVCRLLLEQKKTKMSADA